MQRKGNSLIFRKFINSLEKGRCTLFLFQGTPRGDENQED